MIRDPHDKPESKYNPDAGMSKEDEDKYKRLIEENKQLAIKVKEVRCYIYRRPFIFVNNYEEIYIRFEITN